MSAIQIPRDVYESPREVVIIMPLGGVQKKSLNIDFVKSDYMLIISGKRSEPKVKGDLQPVQQECFRGDFTVEVQLPPDITVDRIHSSVSAENILQLIVPKALVPEKLKVNIKY